MTVGPHLVWYHSIFFPDHTQVKESLREYTLTYQYIPASSIPKVWAMGLFSPIVTMTAVTAVTAVTAGIKSSRVKSTLEIQIEHFVALPSVGEGSDPTCFGVRATVQRSFPTLSHTSKLTKTAIPGRRRWTAAKMVSTGNMLRGNV